MRERLVRVKKWLMSFMPAEMPQSPAALDAFIMEVLEIGKFPKNDSFVSAITSQILHTTVGTSKLNKRMFVNTLKRSIANQLAYGLMMDIKAKEKAEIEQATVKATPSEVVQEIKG
jgi:hypothetical protein